MSVLASSDVKLVDDWLNRPESEKAFEGRVYIGKNLTVRQMRAYIIEMKTQYRKVLDMLIASRKENKELQTALQKVRDDVREMEKMFCELFAEDTDTNVKTVAD